MGLIGLIIAMVVNSSVPALQFTLNLSIYIYRTYRPGYKMQKIYLTHGGDRFGIQFAISLYPNFINQS